MEQGRGGVVVLACHDGAAHLRAQLDSIAAQCLRPDLLIIRDDGSRDDTLAVIRAFIASASGCAVELHQGPCHGAVDNFLTLIGLVPDWAQWLAFADQDDVWLAGKLARDWRLLSRLDVRRPALVGGPSLICGRGVRGAGGLAPVGRSRAPSAPLGFRHALVQNFAGGNTMMVNRAGIDLLQGAAADLAHAGLRPVVHDWWIYQLISGAGGQVQFGFQPLLFYRQHGRNQIGANRGVRAVIKRGIWMLTGRLAYWNGMNIAALQASSPRLTAENRALLLAFAGWRQRRLRDRIAGLKQSGLYRQGRAAQAGLWLAACLGKI